MTRVTMFKPSPSFLFRVRTATGVLYQGRRRDFLLCVADGAQALSRWSLELPNSSLRLHVFYPNRQRVPAADLSSAIRSLGDVKLAAMVFARQTFDDDMAPQRVSARSYGDVEGAHFADSADAVFCQAGVVAPPDSPDLGIAAEISPVALEG